jgi:hypothetical protein
MHNAGMDIDPGQIAYTPSTGLRRVHARVSVNFVEEFGCYLGAPLRAR